MSQAYSDPKRVVVYRRALQNLEVFSIHEPGHEIERVWYWWQRSPGDAPTGYPVGPFATEAEALADAREGGE